MTKTVYIALGSNLDNPQQQVKTAITELGNLANTKVTAISHWYRSSPMGPQNQSDYVNGVAKLCTGLNPQQLLSALQDIENRHNRERLEHWGPRTLDLDLLLYGSDVIDQQNLKVPHPGMTTRNFVLIPLADIDPQLILPNGINLKTLLENCSSEGIVRISSGDTRDTTGQ
ncbi:MAG: 2-amino-4-hydroxy-6-hydroxymethyldihydropteridine diphosphokinase [Porticoccaceae bacterium]|nr:MAG: 2-amino-4-hydroxy-6-hydroxymethyldihydropteridine diphosphokinase [Porticoccaceae bacterium]